MIKIAALFLISLTLSFLIYFKDFYKTLFFLRTLTLFFLFIVIFNPEISVPFIVNKKTFLLIDSSKSMIFNEKWERVKELKKEISENIEVYSFDKKIKKGFPEKPEGEITYLSQALEKIRSKNPLRLLLFSDGFFYDNFSKEFFKNLGFPIDVISIPYKIEDFNFKITDYPSVIKQGEKFIIKGEIESKEAGEALLQIYSEQEKIKEKSFNIKKGENSFYTEVNSFSKLGTKKFLFKIFFKEKWLERDLNIRVVPEFPNIVLVAFKPHPLVKAIRQFLSSSGFTAFNSYLYLTNENIKKIDKKVEEIRSIPASSDWIFFFFPPSEKIINKIKGIRYYIFYEKEEENSLTLKGKIKIRSKNSDFETSWLPLEEISVPLYYPDAEPIFFFVNNEKEVPFVFYKREKDIEKITILFSDLWKLAFKMEKDERDSIFSRIFNFVPLNEPYFISVESPHIFSEEEYIRIKVRVLKRKGDIENLAHLSLSIGNNTFPLFYKGEGVYETSPLSLKEGEYKGKINVLKGNFQRSSPLSFKVLRSFLEEKDKGVNTVLLKWIAEQTGGKVVPFEKSKEYLTGENSKMEKKDIKISIRKNIFIYIIIVFTFCLELFLRKKEGLP